MFNETCTFFLISIFSHTHTTLILITFNIWHCDLLIVWKEITVKKEAELQAAMAVHLFIVSSCFPNYCVMHLFVLNLVCNNNFADKHSLNHIRQHSISLAIKRWWWHTTIQSLATDIQYAFAWSTLTRIYYFFLCGGVQIGHLTYTYVMVLERPLLLRSYIPNCEHMLRCAVLYLHFKHTGNGSNFDFFQKQTNK